MALKLANKSWISIIKSGVNPTDYLFDKIGPTNCDAQGNTFLHYAAYLGNAELCSILLSEGWFVLQKNLRGETPLDYGISHHSVRKVLEAKVNSLPGQVLNFALSSPAQLIKQQIRQNWQAIASPFPDIVIDGTPPSPNKTSEKVSINNSLNVRETEKSSPARKTAHQGHFSPVVITQDPEASDWNLPEELVYREQRFEKSPPLNEKPSSHIKEIEIDFRASTYEMDTPGSENMTDYRVLSSRISSLLLLVRVFSNLLDDKRSGTTAQENPNKIVTEQDHTDYGDAIDVMKRVFDDEVRVVRVELQDRWKNLRSALNNEINEINGLVSQTTSMNITKRPPARKAITKEQHSDYGDSIDVMLRVFAERLASTDDAISGIKLDLVRNLNSLNLEMSTLVDALDGIEHFSANDHETCVSEKDVEEYGESIDVMRQLCRAELSARTSILNDLFAILTK